MKKVCKDWVSNAFDDKLVNASYWQEFEENAKAASAEIIHVKNLQSAQAAISDLIVTLGAKKVIAVGDDTVPELNSLYSNIKKMGPSLYTDKFDIAEHAPTADLGISMAEFGIGETGSVCVDNYSYEARIVGMLPPSHIILLNANHTVKNITTAFEVISRVFNRGYMGFITGPSRTADIERVLSLGVHGPSRFFIIAIDEMTDRRMN
jgi:L-lactate dehydrogenase complex protein LldG